MQLFGEEMKADFDRPTGVSQTGWIQSLLFDILLYELLSISFEQLEFVPMWNSRQNDDWQMKFRISSIYLFQ